MLVVIDDRGLENRARTDFTTGRACLAHMDRRRGLRRFERRDDDDGSNVDLYRETRMAVQSILLPSMGVSACRILIYFEAGCF